MATILQHDLPPPPRTRRRSLFYPGFSLILLLLLVAGFGPTFFFAPLVGNPVPPPHVFAHGVLGTAWFLLLLVQTSLASTGRVRLHRQIGRAGAVLALLVFLGTVGSAILVYPRFAALGIDPAVVFGGMSRRAQIARDSLGVTGFAAYVALAIWQRGKPQVHKRLMLFGSMFLCGAAVSRLVGRLVPIAPPPLTIWLVFLPLIIVIAIHDRMTLGRVTRTTILGGIAFVLAHFVILFVVPPLLS